MKQIDKLSQILSTRKTSYQERGFGIVEVLISAMIIVVISGAIIGLTRAMIRRNTTTAERLQAYNLVREGLELARAARDTAWIDVEMGDNDMPNEWDAYLTGCNENCYLQEVDQGFELASGQEEITIDKDEDQAIKFIRFYNITNIDPIDITNIDPIDNDSISEAKTILVTVQWGGEHNDQYSVSASTVLTNWKPQI